MGAVEATTRSRAAFVRAPAVIPDPELGAGYEGPAHAHKAFVAVGWDSRGMTGAHLDACLLPPGMELLPGQGAAQLTVLLAVTPSAVDGVRAVVAASGEIDVATVEPLHAAALSIVRAAHPRPGQALLLVLDLAAVTFLDSSALHFLVDIHAQGIDEGWTVELRLPAATGPCRLLHLAASLGWLPPDLLQHRAPPAFRSAPAAIPGPVRAA